MDLGEIDELLVSMDRHSHHVEEGEAETSLRRQATTIHTAREELKRRDDIMRTMRARITQLEGHETLIVTLNERIDYLESVEKDKDSLEKEHAQTLEELAGKKALVADLSSQLAAEEAKTADVEEVTNALKDDVKNAENEVREHKRHIALLEKLAENLKSELDSSESQLGVEIKKQIELTNKFEKTNSEWTKQAKNKEAELAAALKINGKLKQDNTKLHHDLKKASGEAHRWKSVCKDLEETLATAKENMGDENEALLQELHAHKAALTSTREDHVAMEERQDQLLERMALVAQEMSAMRALGWPHNNNNNNNSSREDGAPAEEEEEGPQFSADLRACSRNLRRVLDSSKDGSFHQKPPLPPATPHHSSSKSDHHQHQQHGGSGGMGTPAATPRSGVKSSTARGSAVRNSGYGTGGKGVSSRNTSSMHRTAPPSSTSRHQRTPGAEENKVGEGHYFTSLPPSSASRGGSGGGGGGGGESLRPAHGWSHSMSYPAFEEMLSFLIECVDETARLREHLADAVYKTRVSDSACRDATELLDSFEVQLREAQQQQRLIELFAVNLTEVVTAQTRLSLTSHHQAADGMGDIYNNNNYDDENSTVQDVQHDSELRLGELMLLGTGKEKKKGGGGHSSSRLVGVPTVVGAAQGSTSGPVNHLRRLCGAVQKYNAYTHAAREELSEKTSTEAALRERMADLLSMVERMQEEHTTRLADREEEVKRKCDKAWKKKVAEIEAEKESVAEQLASLAGRHRSEIDTVRRQFGEEVQAAKESLQHEYSEKVNDMVIATAEMEIMKDESGTQQREWTLLLDKLVRYLCTLQAKYDDLCDQKQLLLAFSHGLDALRDDLLFLALSCVEHASASSPAVELLTDAQVEFSPAVMHKLHRMSHSRGYAEYGYPTVTRANRQPADGKPGRKYTVPSLRVVAIYILGALRFKRILAFIRDRVKNTLFMRYDGYSETTDLPGVALGAYNPGAGVGGGYSGGSEDPSGSMETALRFAIPTYAELCHLTPEQVAAFVVRSKRGEGVDKTELYGPLTASHNKRESPAADTAGGSPGISSVHSKIGLLHSITASGYGVHTANICEEEDEEDEEEEERKEEREEEGNCTNMEDRFQTPHKATVGLPSWGGGRTAPLPKPAFLSSSPYSPDVLKSALKMRSPSSMMMGVSGATPSMIAEVAGDASFSALTGVGTGHIRSRFLWNRVPGVSDLFCLSQTAVIERALVYMAGQLSHLREEDEALKGAVSVYESNNRNLDEVLGASMSTLEQQAHTIQSMSKHNENRDRNLLKIALGHRRLASVVQATGNVTGNPVPAEYEQQQPHLRSAGNGTIPMTRDSGILTGTGTVASTGVQAAVVENVVDARTLADFQQAGRMQQQEELGAWRKAHFGHADDVME